MGLQLPHLFEFMDLDWLPLSLRNTMREILECGNALPFRPYYDFAVSEILDHAKRENIENIVELGAGTAPLARRLATHPDRGNIRISVCDLNPDKIQFKELENNAPGVITPIYEPVDFSVPRAWPARTLLVLSGTLHHLPNELRKTALRSMSKSADVVLVIEPLRKTILSLIFVILSVVPAIVLPVWFIARPSRLRRFLWCWIPVAPAMFLWDGWISCIREWDRDEFASCFSDDTNVDVDIEERLFTQVVRIARK